MEDRIKKLENQVKWMYDRLSERGYLPKKGLVQPNDDFKTRLEKFNNSHPKVEKTDTADDVNKFIEKTDDKTEEALNQL